MRLNTTLAELNDNNFEEYGEGFYYITVMGTPSDKEPWGWQLDGHHLIVNYFVLGDQVVMTPAFFGSEPATATAGKYKGLTVLRDEQTRALAFVNALTEAQRAKAILEVSKTGNNNVSEAWKDNVTLDYAGVRAVRPDRRAAVSAARSRQSVHRQHGRRAREGEAGGSAAPSRRHVFRVDRRHGAGQRVLLPHPQPGDPDRVRSPDAGRDAPCRGGSEGRRSRNTSTR